jgi:hypothetical protein
MKELQSDPVAKKEYETPKMVAINLRPEEAVLGNCKISGSAGPSSLGGTCVAVGPCKIIGS